MNFVTVVNGKVEFTPEGSDVAEVFPVSAEGGAAYRARVAGLEVTRSSSIDFPCEDDNGVPRHMEHFFHTWFGFLDGASPAVEPTTRVNAKKLERALALLEKARAIFEDLADDAEDDQAEDDLGDVTEALDDVFGVIGMKIGAR